MKFQSIEIDAFGALSGTVLDGLQDGLNVIDGPNGAGKTTLLQFVRGLFCGYDDARRRGLLPADHGGSGGGTVGARWKGRICRFQRPGNAAGERLRATLIHQGRQMSHPGFREDSLPSKQISLLYTVEHSNVHAIDELARMALDDGIDLVSRRYDSDRLKSAAVELQGRQSQLGDVDRGRIAELGQKREQLQAELQQLNRQLQQRCRRFTEEQETLQAADRDHWRQRVDWLHAELQAAESDLREAEERAWQPGTRAAAEHSRPTSPALRPRRIPSTSHIDVDHRSQLEDIDRRMDAARARLAEIAQARMEVDLRAARIAGCATLSTDVFLSRLRDSLSLMEDTLLELQEGAERLDASDERAAATRQSWSSAIRQTVHDARRRLYGTCDAVSQFELQHRQGQLDAELARLEEVKQQQLRELEGLEAQRETLVARAGHLSSWRGPAQRAIEQDLCRCTQHADSGRQCSPQQRPTPQGACAANSPSPFGQNDPEDRPTSHELSRLRRRRQQLGDELDDARTEWRRQRSQPERIELPEDVRILEQQADRKQVELDAVTRELSDAQRRSRVLSVTGEVMRRMSERATEPRCLTWAGEYLARLTADRYVGLVVTDVDAGVRVIDAAGRERPRSTLSRGTLDQLALALRLALVREYTERGIRFPLVLDEALVDCDLERLQDAVGLLTEFAAEQEQQILYLTCGTHLVRLFEDGGATVHSMSPPAARGSAVRSPGSQFPRNWTVRGWIDLPADQPSRPSTAEGSDDSHVRTIRRRQPGSPYWLSMDTPLLQVPSIGEQMGRRLSALGIGTVAELLELSPEESSIPLRSLQVDVERFREWQAEALLLSCVPELTGPDAQLLVACSIYDPRQLAESDVAQLVQRLDRYVRRNRERSLGAELPKRDDLQRWIRNSRRARSLDAARRESARRQRTNRVEDPSSPERAVVARIPSSPSPAETDPPVEPRFYLGPQSPVVDAPSIGPKMASRLESQGIVTVGDLLARTPAHVAERLRHRRVKAETVTRWQQQARLMCRIPQLRGHDAQVLVACEITEPEQVAGMDARTLFAVVGPFVATKEGQRLLRSSKTPDLEEVADWIRWAQQARPLRAA